MPESVLTKPVCLVMISDIKNKPYLESDEKEEYVLCAEREDCPWAERQSGRAGTEGSF